MVEACLRLFLPATSVSPQHAAFTPPARFCLLVPSYAVTLEFITSTLIVSCPHLCEMAHPTAATIVQHDFTSTAKITKKCVERLASFSKMRRSGYRPFFYSPNTDQSCSSSTDSESTQLLSKTSNKIHVLVKLIDSSIANAHLCYLFATSAVTLCEEGSKEDVTMDSLVEMSSKGAKMAKEVASGFKDVEQVVYKVQTNLLMLRKTIQTCADRGCDQGQHANRSDSRRSYSPYGPSPSSFSFV